MKRLLLLRHAKAVRDSDDGDHGRTLNARGREDSARMGALLHVKGWAPDCVLSSAAARTVETWKQLSAELPDAPEPEFLDGLYLASWKSMLNIIRRHAGDDADALLVIGHNPGLEELVLALAQKPDNDEAREALDAMHGKYPTCALSVFDCDIAHWRELAPGGCNLIGFVRPKDLKSE
jgi:phosphohistidine phosphatase